MISSMVALTTIKWQPLKYRTNCLERLYIYSQLLEWSSGPGGLTTRTTLYQPCHNTTSIKLHRTSLHPAWHSCPMGSAHAQPPRLPYLAPVRSHLSESLLLTGGSPGLARHPFIPWLSRAALTNQAIPFIYLQLTSLISLSSHRYHSLPYC
jgi:hypothetical protein